MKLYLDNSFLNRLFDDPTVTVNTAEMEILLWVIELVQSGKVALVNSSIIEYENDLSPFPDRRFFVDGILSLATTYQDVDETVHKRAKVLEDTCRLQPIDALHLASAERSGVDFFITCDYTLLKRYRGTVRAVSPLQFLQSYETGTSQN